MNIIEKTLGDKSWLSFDLKFFFEIRNKFDNKIV